MPLATYLSPYYSALKPWSALSKNPDFNVYTTTPGAPDTWTVISGANPTRQQPGAVGQYAVRVNGGAAAEAGIGQGTPWTGFAGPGWYVVEVVAKVQTGALTGAGVQLAGYTNDTYASQTEAASLVLSTDPDTTGAVLGAGTAGTVYKWRKLVQLKLSTSVSARVEAFAHKSSFGVITSGNNIDFSQASVRPASPAEIAAGNQVQGYPVWPLLPGLKPEADEASLWSTVVKTAASGREKRTALWSYPRHSFHLEHEIIRNRAAPLDEVDALAEIFDTCAGQYADLLLLNPEDYIVSGQTGTMTPIPDGSNKIFQLLRPIRTYKEPVLAPFGITAVQDNGTPTSAYTLGNLGVITFTSAPLVGHTLTWGGFFFFLVRFAKDDLSLKRFLYQLYESDGIDLISRKP